MDGQKRDADHEVHGDGWRRVNEISLTGCENGLISLTGDTGVEETNHADVKLKDQGKHMRQLYMITKTQSVDVFGRELRMQVQYVSYNELINTRIKKFSQI